MLRNDEQSTLDNLTAGGLDGEIKIAVNSLQRTLYVARLYVDTLYTRHKYYYFLPYDIDNLYPNKVQAIAQRSGSTMSAIDVLQKFLSGDGFPQMGQIVNGQGHTLWDILRFCSRQYAMFNGFALHFNYNMLGQITEINPVKFEFVRWNGNLDKMIVNPDWSRRYRKKFEVTYNLYNPDNVPEEITEAGGIDKYNGQLFYWIPNPEDYYTPCYFDAVLDDAQFEAEAKLYGLSSIQNDYSLSGIVTYPKNFASAQEKEDARKEIKGDQGADKAGGVRVIGAMVPEGLTNWKWFTPISRNNIDDLHTNQIERAKMNIYYRYNQPPILSGISADGMFNEASFADAFNYYNAVTETDRKDLERELNKILQRSIWAGLGEIQIQPKKFVTRESITNGIQPAPGQVQAATPAPAPVNDTLTNLTGRQLQGVFRITKRFKKGELTHDQAAIMLRDGFGFTDEQVEVWLINDDLE